MSARRDTPIWVLGLCHVALLAFSRDLPRWAAIYDTSDSPGGEMTTSPPDVGDRLAAPQPAEPTPPPELPDTDQSNATRYLCVGAQIDDAFGDSVIQEVLEQHHRAVAPTFGLDLIRVVVHALNARGRRKRRDLLLVILAVADLLIAPVITIVMALSWLWIRFVYRLTRQQRPSWHQRYALYLATIASVIVVPVLALTALLLSVVVGLLTPYVASMPVILVWPARLGFWLPSPLKGCLVFLSLGLAWSVLCWHRLSTRRVLLDTLRPDAFRLGHLPLVPDYHPRIHDRFMCLQEDQRSSNVTVYSGFSPFLGAGDELQTWGFTVDLSQGAQRSDGEVGKPRPFSLTKLHRHVRQRVQALSDPELPPEQRISNLVIEDRLFVSGDAVQRDRRFLPRRDAPPVAQVSPRVIHEMLNKPTGAIRHFKCIRVDSWTREGRVLRLSSFRHPGAHALCGADGLSAAPDQDELSPDRPADPAAAAGAVADAARGNAEGTAGQPASGAGRADPPVAIETSGAAAGQAPPKTP